MDDTVVRIKPRQDQVFTDFERSHITDLSVTRYHLVLGYGQIFLLQLPIELFTVLHINDSNQFEIYLIYI
jgi:hypothetical protein